MHRFRVVTLVCAGVFILTGSAHAALLSFFPSPGVHSYPDIESSLISYTYTVNNTTHINVLTASGRTQSFNSSSSSSLNITNNSSSSFSLTVDLDSSGNLLPFGAGITDSLTLTGANPHGGSTPPNTYYAASQNTGTALSIQAFGFNTAATGGYGQVFEFVFVENSSVAGLTDGEDDPGNLIGVTLLNTSGSTPNFSSSFSGSLSTTSSDAFPVPEPSSIALLAGAVGLFVRRPKRNAQNQSI